MIRRFLFSLIFFLILVLPASPIIAPGSNPVPETDKTSPLPKQQEQVIVITTAKDPKVVVTTVGKNGEIIVPQSSGGTTTSTPATSKHSQVAASLAQTSTAGADEGIDSENSKETRGFPGVSASAGSGSEPGSTGLGQDQAAGSPSSGVNPGLGGGFPFGFDWTAPPVPVPVPPTLPTAQLQALLNQSVTGTGVPGAIMAVQTRLGTWIGAAGTANTATGQLVTTDMQVNLAAGTKLFTAALIMKLAEESKLALTDTVEKWLPGQVMPGGDPTAAQKITVGMLLNHTSGLHDHETTTEFEVQLFPAPTSPWSNADVRAIINSYPLDFTPGTAYGYYNSNYYLLGMIAEAAAGDKVENLIQSRFCGPLGMTRTALSPSGLKTAPYLSSYWFGVPPYAALTDTTNWDLSWDWTSGSGVSTAQDMLTWLQALFGNRVVLSTLSLGLMTTPQAPATAYGYGLMVMNPDTWYGELLLYHTGENPGVLTYWLYYPTSGRIIIIALNRDDKRFFTTVPPPQIDANQVAAYLLNGVSSLLTSTKSQ